jgi:RHS repeat-associated protein
MEIMMRDIKGRVYTGKDYRNTRNHFGHDAEHHPTVTKSCNYTGTTCTPVTAGDGKEIKSSAMYYTNGLTETTTDAKGTVATLIYDAYGNPDTAKVGSHTPVDFTYDPIGRMTGLTDQVSSPTSFVYDKRNLLTKKTDPLLKDTILTYDNAGRLASRKDRNLNTITYTYTPTSKIDTITYPDTSTVHYTYNQHDDLTGMQDSVGNTNYVYDAALRLTSSTFNPYGFTVSYSKYDENSNLTELTYPGNKKVIYTYDELNRLKTVKIDWLSPKPVATYYYDDAGRLDYLVNFNGTITDYSYDNANRLTALDNKKSDNTTILANYSFTLDANGNRTNIVQNEPLTLTPNTSNVNYTYNTKKNRLLTAGTNSFAYDNEGQLSSGYSAAYTFDYEHRLKTIGSTITFSYDGAGNRVQAVRNGVTIRYIYDASGNLLAEADGSNNITKYYIHGLGLMAMVTSANAVYTYHFNAVGSTIAMTDSSQNMVNKYAYDAFGNIAANSVESVSQPFKFVGQFGVMTEPNGFYYMQARYYDPNVGRFISEDPIGLAGGINVFIYASNNPILFIDPSGLINWERMGWGALKVGGGALGLYGASVATAATGGIGAIPAIGLALGSGAAIGTGFSEIILGAIENSSNSVPQTPPVSMPALATLAAGGSMQTAENVEFGINAMLLGKSLVMGGTKTPSTIEAVGTAYDFISSTHDWSGKGCK